ncbi:MAG: PCRF domain-containing protein [Candidatus Paceibacterota bacterium]
MEDNENINQEIERLEALILLPDFWLDKNEAQRVIKEIQDLKDKREGSNKWDKGSAIVSIISGAGGDDAEDFSSILFSMYLKYANKKGWNIFLIHENKNEHGGYRNISFEVEGPRAYGLLKNEGGVHRLVRISPFNAKKLRHTSFSLVEVLPKFSKLDERDFEIPLADLKVEFAKSGGPGGQNVNKRETAVRIIHIPTNISVHATGERSQEANRERAMNILRAKIFQKAQNEKKTFEESMKISKGTSIEWGNQIRSYVMHPYKMVKDHRTDVETSQIEDVLEGELDIFMKKD